MREPAIAALLARLSQAYPWAAPPSRRLKLWSDVPAAMRPACFVHEGGAETYADAAGTPKRMLGLRLFVYADAHDPGRPGAATLNAIMDALDDALATTGADASLGRCTLGGTAWRCGIEGKVLKDPGDLDGDALLVVPITIVLP